MNTKIIIVHGKDIISQGLAAIIGKKYDIDIIAIDSVSGLLNYHSIANHKLIFLIESSIESNLFKTQLEIFRKNNDVKIVLVHDKEVDRLCKHECDCCCSVETCTEKLVALLEPYITSKKPEKKVTAGLTEREIDVIKLVAGGKTNKEIAEELFISIHTVISHRKNITEKLGIKSISGLTVFAILNNLIDTTAIDPDGLI
jgi:DNA-binding CsgD family transcriptional regulator